MALVGAPRRSSGLEHPSLVREVRGSNFGEGNIFQQKDIWGKIWAFLRFISLFAFKRLFDRFVTKKESGLQGEMKNVGFRFGHKNVRECQVLNNYI